MQNLFTVRVLKHLKYVLNDVINVGFRVEGKEVTRRHYARFSDRVLRVAPSGL